MTTTRSTATNKTTSAARPTNKKTGPAKTTKKAPANKTTSSARSGPAATLEPLPDTAGEVRLTKHVKRDLTRSHLELVQVEVKEPANGQVLVRNEFLQLGAVMKDLMTEEPGLPMMPAYHPGEALWAQGVGTVVRSGSDDFEVGDLVFSMDGWREYSLGPAEQYTKVARGMYPGPEYFLTQGPTAYHGIVDIAEVGEGDVVFVTGAAGGVGSLAGQIAKNLGAKKVIGSAGSKAKVDYLVKELGYDAAFDYHDTPVADRLAELAPDGIDVLFDTVGGEQFEAALANAAPDARLALCGALSGQIGPSTEGAFPRLDIMHGIVKQVVIKPFSTYHTPEQIGNWHQHFMKYLGEGTFVFPHTIVEGGIEAAPEALINLTEHSKYTGNVLVRHNGAASS